MNDKNDELKSVEELKAQIKMEDSKHKQLGFVIPDNYFDKMQEDVMNQLVEGQRIKSGRFRRLWIPAVAASVLLLSVFLVQQSNDSNSSTLAMQTEEESATDYMDFLIENPEVVSEDVLLEMEDLELVMDSWEEDLYSDF